MPHAAGVGAIRPVLWATLLSCLPMVSHALEPGGVAGDAEASAPELQNAAAAWQVEPTMVGIDDAFTTGASLSELEFTVVYTEASREFGRDGSTSDRPATSARLGVVTFSHGLTQRVDVTASAFGVSYTDETETGSRSRGLGDLFTDVKWRFHGDGVDGLQLAYRPGLSIPVGTQDDGDAEAPGLGFWTINQVLLLTVVEHRWALGVETGFLYPIGDRDGERGFGLASAGVGYQVTPRLKPELELSYLRDFVDEDADAEVLAATGGLIVNASASIRLDLGLRYGLWGENADQRLTLSANLSLSFGPSANRDRSREARYSRQPRTDP